MFEQVSRVLGLDGLAVTAVRERADELEVEVELTVPASSCRLCGGTELEVKERPRVRVRDLPLAGRRVTIVWRKRRFRCRRCRRSFSESHAGLPGRQRVSRRFRAHLFQRLRGGGAQLEVAREEQTSRYQVERAFRAGAAQELGARPRPLARRLCIDEAAHRRGSKRLVTVVCDPDRRCVVEVLEGRDRRTLERFLRALPEPQRQALEAVSIDPAFAYREALRAALPGVPIVVDPFHLVRGANRALDTVRRERQRFRRRKRPVSSEQRTGGFRPHLWHARRRLLKGRERLTEQQRRSLCELFQREPLLAEAWGLKERFRAIYRSHSREQAEQRLELFLSAAERAQIPSFLAFANGLRDWREELLAYFDEPTTNGYAEGVINKIKVIKRRAYGLPNFDSFRTRILVACG
jgi:transposase